MHEEQVYCGGTGPEEREPQHHLQAADEGLHHHLQAVGHQGSLQARHQQLTILQTAG